MSKTESSYSFGTLAKIVRHEKFNSYALFALYVLVIVIGIFFYVQNNNQYKLLLSENEKLSSHIASLEADLATTTLSLASNIETTKNSLSTQIAKEKDALNQQLGSVQGQVGSLSGSLNTLEKLSKTDAELLQKYSKVYFLNEHYQPVSLTQIPEEYGYSDKKTYQFQSDAWPFLQSMLNAAKNDGVDLYVFSAFRSFDEQEALKGQYTVTYGAGTANQFSADQGYSEHQLGTTLDIMTTGIGGVLDKFKGTDAYTWLQNNAYKYGFVLSYPENNSYYVFEPWHWRFVGRALANDLHGSGRNFYDLDQREIDTYLVKLFDK